MGERSAQSGLPALLLAVWILYITYRVLDACPMKHLFDVTCTAPAVLINGIDSIREAGDHFARACPVSYALRRRSYGDSFHLYLQLFLLPAGAGRRQGKPPLFPLHSSASLPDLVMADPEPYWPPSMFDCRAKDHWVPTEDVFSMFVDQDMFSYFSRPEGNINPKTFAAIYCLNPPGDDDCPIGLCPNPDVAGPLLRIARMFFVSLLRRIVV